MTRKAKALNRIVRREWSRSIIHAALVEGCPGDETCQCREYRRAFKAIIQRVAAECAEIVADGAEGGGDWDQALRFARKQINEAFGLEEKQ